MQTRITVRVYPREEREIVSTTAELFQGDGKNEVCETLVESEIVTKKAKYTRVDGSQRPHDKLQVQSKYITKRPDQSVLLRDEDDEESLTNLFNMLLAARHVQKEGRYIVINISDFDHDDMESLLDELLADTDRLKLLPLAMKIAEHDEIATQFDEFVSDHPGHSRIIADGLTVARRSRELQAFRNLVEQECEEEVYQEFLQEHLWIFGSEYNKMFDRYIVKRKQFDFPVQRTADGYLEIIEIKRPDHTLFTTKKDKHGRNVIDGETPTVVKAIYQVDDYLARVDKEMSQIQDEEDIPAEKVRGKIVIGNSAGDESQVKALRRLNARMHRMEVMSFDQLIANAQRMLDMMQVQQGIRDQTDEIDQRDSPPFADDSDWQETGHNYPDAPATVDDIPF